MQRIIRFERRLSTLEFGVPHSRSYHTTRDRLLDFTSRYEFHLNIDRASTEEVILLAQPEDDELAKTPRDALLFDYWRMLFHIRIHIAMRDRLPEHHAAAGLLQDLQQLGALPFAEVRNVLHSEELLLPPVNDQGIFVEFAATFLELWYFTQDLNWYFPAIDDFTPIIRMLTQYVDHQKIQQQTRIEGSAELEQLARTEDSWRHGLPNRRQPEEQPSIGRSRPRVFRRLVSRANRLGKIGNYAKAAIVRQKSIRAAPPGKVAESEENTRAELQRIGQRLCNVLGMDQEGDVERWANALVPLLEFADRGFRTIESHLLYDLQTVCLESERGVYSVDLLRWAGTLGRLPLRRPLPLLRQVLAAPIARGTGKASAVSLEPR